MKKITSIAITLLLVLSMGASTKEQASASTSSKKEQVKTRTSQANKKMESNKNTVQTYTKLIGLNKEQLIATMGEKPTIVDEGGLHFPKSNITAWCGDDGKTVNEVYIGRKDVDFNGAKIGGSIEEFKKRLGKPVEENKATAYMRFNYNKLVLNVSYDSNTKKVVGVNLLKEWK